MMEDAVNNQVPLKSRMPPPLPCLVGVILGLICDWFWPWPIASQSYALSVGIVLVGVVVGLLVTVIRAFNQNGTAAHPGKETTAIIDTGLFGISRNPAYVTVAVLQAAIGFLVNSVWIVLFILPAVMVIHHVVVLREEAYLEAKFGDEYRRYKSRVRRWI